MIKDFLELRADVVEKMRPELKEIPKAQWNSETVQLEILQRVVVAHITDVKSVLDRIARKATRLDTGEIVTPLAHWTEHRVEGINQVEWHDSTGIVAVEYL